MQQRRTGWVDRHDARTEPWIRAHPWRWAALLGLGMGATRAVLHLAGGHPAPDALLQGLAQATVAFVSLGLVGWPRQRRTRSRPR